MPSDESQPSTVSEETGEVGHQNLWFSNGEWPTDTGGGTVYVKPPTGGTSES